LNIQDLNNSGKVNYPEELNKKNEEKIKFLCSIINDIPESVIILDTDFTITYLNEACEKLFGYKFNELRKKSAGIVVKEDNADLINPEICQTISSGKSFYGSTINKRKNGTTFYSWYAIIPLKNDQKEIYSFLLFTRDITEHKQTEERFQQIRKMDSFGTMAGGISHDFNNLLMEIMGNLDVLLMESSTLTENQKECLTAALTGCERAAQLVKQIQMLSKGIISRKENIDVYDAVKQVLDELDHKYKRIIETKIKFKKGEFFVKAGKSEINQIFKHLCSNAVDAIMQKKNGTENCIIIDASIYYSTNRDITGLSPGEYVYISFKDTGTGMSEETKKKAFDPLFTTKGKGSKKGRGLGLAIVYNLVTRSLEGHISVDSNTFRGTTFHIYLPKADSDKQSKIFKPTRTKGRKETILIIEDEESIVKLARTILENSGYNVLTAENGLKGLEMFLMNKNSIDLVILDLIIPEMSGQMVFEEMIKIDPEIKVIISSGYSEGETVDGIISMAKGYVNKPYRIKELTETVRAVLDS